MNDHKLKLILTVLSAFVFSLIFILLAFVVPIHDEKEKSTIIKKKAQNRLESISETFKNR